MSHLDQAAVDLQRLQHFNTYSQGFTKGRERETDYLHQHFGDTDV